MKKAIIFLLSAILLCGCASGSDDAVRNYLSTGSWEGYDAQCSNVIRFNEDGTFSNSCACGEPVGDADLASTYKYKDSDKTIELLDEDKEVIETGKLLFVDDMYLVVNLWDRCYVYENQDATIPVPMECADEYFRSVEMPQPCLSIIDYKDGELTVSSLDYDTDEADSYKKWTLTANKDITFLSVSVTVDNGTESMDASQLSESDLENIGDYYTDGYVEFNENGEVVAIVFYGETIIQ